MYCMGNLGQRSFLFSKGNGCMHVMISSPKPVLTSHRMYDDLIVVVVVSVTDSQNDYKPDCCCFYDRCLSKTTHGSKVRQ